MKKSFLFAIAACVLFTSTAVYADIQSPPGGVHNRVRKLSRSVGNILFGINEIPYQWRRAVEEEGSVYGATYGIINGSYRTLVRAGYGVYEFATFPVRTYKGSFKPGYRGKSIWWDLNHGYHELAPEGGFQTKWTTAREQSW